MVYSQPRNIFVKRDVKLTEPPDAEPHVRWCERSAAKAVSYSIYDSITLGTDTEWRHVWVLLDSQDEDGLPITYDVVATAPIGYTAEVQGSASEGFTVVYRPAK